MSAPARPDGHQAPAPRLDALVCRFAGAMAFLAAAAFLLCLFAVTRLPFRTVAGAGVYAIPGTARAIDAAIVPVLAGCAAAAALCGLAAFALGRLPVRAPAKPRPAQVGLRRRWRPAAVLLIGAAALVFVVLLKR